MENLTKTEKLFIEKVSVKNDYHFVDKKKTGALVFSNYNENSGKDYRYYFFENKCDVCGEPHFTKRNSKSKRHMRCSQKIIGQVKVAAALFIEPTAEEKIKIDAICRQKNLEFLRKREEGDFIFIGWDDKNKRVQHRYYEFTTCVLCGEDYTKRGYSKATAHQACANKKRWGK